MCSAAAAAAATQKCPRHSQSPLHPPNTHPHPAGSAAAAPALFKGDLLNASYYPTKADAAAANKRWYVIDAEGQTLGRLATLAATYIRGKHEATYTPSMDMGAFVVVTNADKVFVCVFVCSVHPLSLLGHTQ